MIKQLKKLNSAGDTIVEVMVVLAVLGLALSIAYATANRGLQQSRNAQEHSQALGIINSQVELLRSAYAQHGGTAIETKAAAGPFCLAPPPAGSASSPTSLGTGPKGFNNLIGLDHLNNTVNDYKGPCFQNNLYNISIVGQGGGIYDFRVRWNGLGSLGLQQEELTYRIGNVTVSPNNGYTDNQSPPPPPFSGALNVIVQAIPPRPGNTTPSCADASQPLSGTNVTLTDNSAGGAVVGTKSTDVNSKAAFTGIQQGDTFTAAISRSGFGLCPGGSTGVASATAPIPVISRTIYPICTTTTITTYGWVWGNRRADLDGYYYTIPPAVPANTYPGAYTSFVTGSQRAAGNFVYVWSGDNSRSGEGLLYYWLWEVSWAPVSTTTTSSCPS